MNGFRNSIKGLAQSVSAQFRLPDDLILSRDEVDDDGPWDFPDFTEDRVAEVGQVVKVVVENEDSGARNALPV